MNTESANSKLPSDDSYVQLVDVASNFYKNMFEPGFKIKKKHENDVSILDYDNFKKNYSSITDGNFSDPVEAGTITSIAEGDVAVLKSPTTDETVVDASNHLINYNNIKSKTDGRAYKIEKIIYDEKSGFQAIIYRDINTNYSILAIGGSYPGKKPLLNPIAWKKDWVNNNIPIALNKVPPQMDVLLRVMEENKEKYNIQEVVGYSLGAVEAGALSLFEEYKDLKYILYNGGLPKELIPELRKKYEGKITGNRVKQNKFINPKDANITTFLSKDKEFISMFKTLVAGRGGVYRSIHGNMPGISGHRLLQHYYQKKDDYVRVDQEGNYYADNLRSNFYQTDKGAGMQISMPLPPMSNDNNKKNKPPIKLINNVKNSYNAERFKNLFLHESSDEENQEDEFNAEPVEILDTVNFINNNKSNLENNIQLNKRISPELHSELPAGCPFNDPTFLEQFCTKEDVLNEIDDIVTMLGVSLGAFDAPSEE